MPSEKHLSERCRKDSNYRTVRLGFSKLLGTLSCDKICIYLLRIHYKKIRKGLIWWWLCDFFSDFLFKSICCGYSFELHQQVDAIQMSTHNICLYKEVKKKRTLAVIWRLWNDCALIGVCAVIRSNTVVEFPSQVLYNTQGHLSILYLS